MFQYTYAGLRANLTHQWCRCVRRTRGPGALWAFAGLLLALTACSPALALRADPSAGGIQVNVTRDIEGTPAPLESETPGGAGIHVLSPEETLRQDAQQYAKEMGVTQNEAMRRFQSMDDIGALNAALRAREPDTFAGLWVEHQPTFRVLVSFTRRGKQTIRPYVEGKPWAHMVEVRPASVTLVELEAIHAEVQHILQDLEFRVNSALDVKKNCVQVWVTDPQWFEGELREAGYRLPKHVELVVVQGHSAQEQDVCAPSPVPGVAFPRQAPVEGLRVTLTAELIGELALVEGCLRVDSIYGPTSYLLVWPPEFALRAQDGGLQVLDGTGQVVAHTGQELYVSGGEGSAAAMPDCVREQLPASCTGPYWIVGDEVRETPGYALADLVEDLRNLGHSVALTERPVDHGFAIQGLRVLVEEAPVYVYEFVEVAAARAAAAGISADAYSLTIVRTEGEVTYEHHGDWVETPHVYLKGRLIVIVGDHPRVLEALESLLGTPLTFEPQS